MGAAAAAAVLRPGQGLITAAIVALTAAATILTNSGFTLAEEIKKSDTKS